MYLKFRSLVRLKRDVNAASTRTPQLFIRRNKLGRFPALDGIFERLADVLPYRETAELRAETLQMGYSLKRLLMELEGQDEKARAPLDCLEEMAFPTAFAFAVAQWHLPAQPALVAYLWAWLESQVMAAIKLVPLGQTDGQRILLALGERLSAVSVRAAAIADDELGSFAPALAIFSSRHETQYSRLFRS